MLSVPLDEFEVSVGSAEPPRILKAPGGSGETSRWSLVDLTPGRGYVAAVAAAASGGRTKRQMSELLRPGWAGFL